MASMDPFAADDIRRKIAMSLLMQGMDTSPIKSWTQGAARLAQTFAGNYGLNQLDEERKRSMNGLVDALMSGQSSPSGGMPQAAVSPQSQPETPTPGPTMVATDQGTTIPLPQSNPLAGLNPEFRSKFADLRNAAADQGAYFNAPPPGSIGGIRTQPQQDALYAQGRTAPGSIVTYAPFSNHQTGRALDVSPAGTDEATIGRVVTALTQNDPRFAGMRSGATFSNLNDPLHVELNRPSWLPGGGVSSAQAAPQGPPQEIPGTMPATQAPPLPPPQTVAQAPQIASAPQGAPQGLPTQPPGFPPSAQNIPPHVATAIRNAAASDDPVARQFAMSLLNQYAQKQIATPQAMKIQNRDGSESIVFVKPEQMGIYGAGGTPMTGSTISGGTPQPDMNAEQYSAFLQKSDPGRFNLIQGMISGNLSPAQLSRYGTKQVQALLEDAARIEPGFTAANWDARHKMATGLADMNTASAGGRIQSLQNSIEHLANTSDSLVKKGNYDLGVTPLTAGVNRLRGLTTAQDAINRQAEAEARIYGGERTKFLTGRGGTAEERDYLSSKLGAGPAPQAMAGTVEGELAQVRDAITNQENVIRQTMGEKYLKDHPVIGPTHKAAMERLEKNISTLRGNTPEAPQQSFTPPANWQFSPSRKQYRDPQGNLYDENGKPVK